MLPVLGFLFLSLGLVVAIVGLSSNHRKIAIKQLNLDQSMYVAEAGLERGCRYLESNVVRLVVQLSNSTNINGVINNGTYSYAINRVNSTTFSIVSTGAVNGVTRQVSILRIVQPTYAQFALWSHVNGSINIVAGEVFNGHVHADDRLYFTTSSGVGATFHNYCTSYAGDYSANGNINGSLSGITFDYGLELNSYQGTMADVDFNSTTNTSMKNIATSVGLVLSGAATMTFNGATISISNTARGWTNYVFTPNTTNGIIYVANNGTTSGANAGIAHLKGGTTSGRLMVVTENDIIISGNLTYTVDPRSNSTSTCALGLIAADDIVVNTNAPNNATICAAMMATGTSADGTAGSFGVLNYNSGSSRGPLTLYGGIVQNTRGAVGTGGVGGTGYYKNYSYDPRFLSAPPPYYPVISGMVRFFNWTEGPKQ